MKERTRYYLWLVLATGILVGLVYLSDPSEFVAVLSGSEPIYVVAAIGCGCFTLLMWSVVWYRFFEILEIQVTFPTSMRLLLAGTFLNSVTPLGRFGGEPIMAHLITRRTGASFQQALSSVSSADLSNAVPFVTTGLAAVFYLALYGVLPPLAADLASLLVGLAVLGSIVIYLLWFGGAHELFSRLGRYGSIDSRFGRWQPYLRAFTERIRKLLIRMREIGDQPRAVLVTLGFSHAAILGHVGAVHFALLAVGVEPAIQGILLVVTLSAFLTFSPTPGSTGTFEAGFAGLIVVFFPVTAATATSIAILYRVGTYLPGLILGYGSLTSLKRLDGQDSPPST